LRIQSKDRKHLDKLLIQETQNKDGPLIGLMADSHGQVAPINAALEYFRSRGCKCIYHLGDVCDSAHPETAADCLQPLLEEKVIVLKGNNDHTLVANYADQAGAPVPKSILKAIQGFPLQVEHEGAILTHSLPFERELGLVSMTRSMERAEADWFFDTTNHSILFRAHSHNPEIIWRTNNKILRQPITNASVVDLRDRIPCIVICGALTRGLCMTWRPEEQIIESIPLTI